MTDATGAAVPGVTVQAVNGATNLGWTAKTSNSGVYVLSNLPPGSYTVTVEKAGFRSVQFNGITLTVDQTLTLDAQLQVSARSETVEVSGGEVAPIDLTDAQISNVVQSNQMKSLPLIVRDAYSLVLLSPGVIQSNSGLGGFSFNGQRERNNNFLLDGVDNNDTDVPGIASGLNALNPDSAQEFRVITNNFAPEYGRNTGAIIDVKTPSGTNKVHGNAYEFGRYDALGARDFFNHVPGTRKNPYVRNDFGGSAGGPIVKDKTFWYGNYEGQRFITAITNQATVPTKDFLTGKFNFCSPSPCTPVPIDVSSATASNNATGLNPDLTVASIWKLYPVPNGPGLQGAGDDSAGILFFPSTSRSTVDDFTINVDHRLASKHSLAVRYAFNRFQDPDAFHDDILPNDLGATQTYQRTQGASVHLASTLTNTLVNEFVFGGNRTNLQFNCTGTKIFDSFGLVDSFGRGADFGFPTVQGIGCLALGDSNGQARFTGTYHTSDNLTWAHGSHTFKYGGEFRDVYSNSFDNFGSRDAFAFNFFTQSGGSAQALKNLPASIIGNAALEDQVFGFLGDVFSQSQSQFFNAQLNRTGSDLRGFRQREWSLFWQDSWKVRSNLTFTYGLRYEYYGVPFEVNGNFSNFFGNPAGAAPFTFTILKPGRSQVYNNDWNGWEPRLGFSWDPFKSGKTAVRGGFGMFRDRAYGNLFGNVRGNPPFNQSFSFFGSGANQLSSFSAPLTVPTSVTLQDFSFFFPVLIDQNFKVPYTESWNFGVQRQVWPSLTVEANYVGSHSLRLFREMNANPPQPILVNQLLTFCSNPSNTFGCTAATVSKFNLYIGDLIGTLPFAAVNNRAFVDPSSFSEGGALIQSIAQANYHGLQLNVTKRMSQGFQIQGAYTYSHAIDNASDPLVPAAGNRSLPRNNFNLRPERGNSDFDVRQRAVINFIYDPNIGRGKGHLRGGFVGRAFEGWELAGIFTVQGGLPYDIFGFIDGQHTGLSDRATLVDKTLLHTPPPGLQFPFTGVSFSAFNDDITNPPVNQASNLTRNQFFGPGQNNWDFTLQKETAIAERAKFQLRFEFYNLFNRTEFGQPGNFIGNPGTFGQSSSTVTRADGTTSARQIQIAGKFIF